MILYCSFHLILNCQQGCFLILNLINNWARIIIRKCHSYSALYKTTKIKIKLDNPPHVWSYIPSFMNVDFQYHSHFCWQEKFLFHENAIKMKSAKSGPFCLCLSVLKLCCYDSTCALFDRVDWVRKSPSTWCEVTKNFKTYVIILKQHGCDRVTHSLS